MCTSQDKKNQEGSESKDPRHIYANPAQPECCWVLALGLYLSANPTLAFPGSNQKSRFCKTLGRRLEEITGQKVYGTHSIRKGVATYASSGGTGGPSNVSVCLRFAWSFGDVRDRYFRYEAAGNQYLGRVVAGLPQDSPQFTELPPHFDNPNADVVKESTFLMFSAAQNNAYVASILQLCFASLVKTFVVSFRKHTSCFSYVFRQPDKMTTLQVMLADGRTSWMCPTGIPPHVELFQQPAQIRQALKYLPHILLGVFSIILEEKRVGRQSLTRETLTVTINHFWRKQGSGNHNHDLRKQLNLWMNSIISTTGHLTEEFHRMPETFEFPQLDALGIWRL